jgi:hypothetical protein
LVLMMVILFVLGMFLGWVGILLLTVPTLGGASVWIFASDYDASNGSQ